MSVKIDRDCSKCGAKNKQYVGYTEKDGRITIDFVQYKCSFCSGFLEEPTPGEVRRALFGE